MCCKYVLPRGSSMASVEEIGVQFPLSLTYRCLILIYVPISVTVPIPIPVPPLSSYVSLSRLHLHPCSDFILIPVCTPALVLQRPHLPLSHTGSSDGPHMPLAWHQTVLWPFMVKLTLQLNVTLLPCTYGGRARLSRYPPGTTGSWHRAVLL